MGLPWGSYPWFLIRKKLKGNIEFGFFFE
jgi:hypothetical protein